MVTLVGTQNRFHDALKELVELNYDIIDAYQVAIDKLTSVQLRMQFIAFKKDYENQIAEIGDILSRHNQVPPRGTSLAKKWITRGKVILANLFNNKAILIAMKSNEEDSNAAYENILKHLEKWSDTEAILLKGLADVRRHRDNIEFAINNQGEYF